MINPQERKGLKSSTDKTDHVMVYCRMDETSMVRDRAGNVLKQTKTFTYVGSVMNA